MASYASQRYKEIVTCDEDKANVLRIPSRVLKEEEWALVQSTAERLLFVRNNVLKGGAGLAAPQIGINCAIFLYTPDRTTENLRVVVNPSFEPIGEDSVVGAEACFSAPLCCTKLKRWQKIKVRYQTLDQKWVEDVLEGFAAKVFQHEMDHLLGRLTIDHPTADITTFTDAKMFEDHMKQVHLEESKVYPKNTNFVHHHDTLKSAAIRYIDFLNEQGKTDSQSHPSGLKKLFADNLELVISGISVFKTSDQFIPRLQKVQSQLGPWNIKCLDRIASKEDQACAVRYLFRSSTGGDYTTLAILRLNDQGLIREINEVYNKFDGSEVTISPTQKPTLIHSYDTLKTAARAYIEFLNQRGGSHFKSDSAQIGTLFAPQLKKVINGAAACTTRDQFELQLQDVQALAGSWTIKNMESVTSSEDQTFLVRYVLQSTKIGDYTTLALLRLDDAGLIKEINEVYNKYEQ